MLSGMGQAFLFEGIPDMREDLRKAIAEGDSVLIHKQFSGVCKAFDEVARTARFVISTGDVDRDNDTINPEGWDIESFKSNPVVLWAHNSNVPPIGKAIDVATKGRGSKKKLVATAMFAKREQHELADTVFQLIVGGFLNATSVGFQPTDAEWNADRGGFDFKAQELHEFSVVPVPANPNAVLTAQAKGIDVGPVVRWAEYTLDHFEQKNAEAEVLYKLIKAPVKQVDLTDLPEEVAMAIEMVDLDIPGVKDALAHAVSEEAEAIATFEGVGDLVSPQADGDDGDNPESDPDELDLGDANQNLGSQELEILESDSEGSSSGEGDQDNVLDMEPDDLKAALQQEVKLQIAAVSGKLPE